MFKIFQKKKIEGRKNFLREYSTLLTFIGGISFIIASILLDDFLEAPTHVALVAIHLLSHFGIGLLVLSMLTLVMDIDHWTKYFEKRISKVVMEKGYLQQQDQNSLIKLQTDVLKAYFRNDELGGKDGFLTYYQKNIQDFINTPFRTNVNMDINVRFNPSDATQLIIDEELSWICKATANKIQDVISYEPDPGEYIKASNYEIIFKHDTFEKDVLVNLKQLKDEDRMTSGDLGFIYPITGKLNIDNLYIKIHSEFIISKSRIMAWRMSHPTKDVVIRIQYPKELSLITELFFNENNVQDKSHKPSLGSYHITIKDWLMPNEGIAFQYIT